MPYAPSVRSATFGSSSLRRVVRAESVRDRLEVVHRPEVAIDAVLVARVDLDLGDPAVLDRVVAARREDDLLAVVQLAVAGVLLDDLVVAHRAEGDVVDDDAGLHEGAEERDDLVGAAS